MGETEPGLGIKAGGDGVFRQWLNNPELAYLVIVALCILMYKLGFQERKLPLLKSAIVYLALLLGCFPLTTLYMLGLPIVDVLVVGSLVLVAYRLRRRRPDQQEQ